MQTPFEPCVNDNMSIMVKGWGFIWDFVAFFPFLCCDQPPQKILSYAQIAQVLVTAAFF